MKEKSKIISAACAAILCLSGCTARTDSPVDSDGSQTQSGTSESVSAEAADKTAEITADSETASEQSSAETSEQPEEKIKIGMFDVLPEIPVTDPSMFKYEYDEELEGIVITDFLTEDTGVRIPDTIEGKPVVGLRLYAVNEDLDPDNQDFNYLRENYYKEYDITELIMPDTVKILDIAMPYGHASEFRPKGAALSKVEYMNIPAELSVSYAKLDLLKALYIDDGAKYLPMDFFSNAENLTTLYIPGSIRAFDKVKYYDSGEQKEAGNLSTVYYNGEIYSGYTDELHRLINDVNGDGFYIRENKAGDSSSLAGFYSDRDTVVIPDGVTYIDYTAFQGNENIRDVTIPASVNGICNDYAFWGFSFGGCTNLTTLTFEEGSEMESVYGFNSFSNLKNLILPDGAASIDDALNKCTGLQSVTIPDSVTKISGSFGDCTGLISVTIPGSVTEISNSFNNCTGLKSLTIPDGVTTISGSFTGCTGLTSLTIPGSVTTIDNDAFSGCTNLTEITIADDISKTLSFDVIFSEYRDKPDLKIHYKGKTFSDLDKLRKAVWGYDSKGFKIVDGVLESYSGEEENVVIPDGVTAIGDDAFSEGIVTITIPASVKEIRGFYDPTAPEVMMKHGPFGRCGYGLKKIIFEGTLDRLSPYTFSAFGDIYDGELRIGYGTHDVLPEIVYDGKTFDSSHAFMNYLGKDIVYEP